MADDTPTVEQAIKAHQNAMNNLTCPLPNNRDKEWDDAVRTMDALIAAVRAEPPLTDDDQTRVCAANGGLCNCKRPLYCEGYRDGQNAIRDKAQTDALIAAVRAERHWHCAVCGGTLACEDCSRGIVSHDMLG